MNSIAPLLISLWCLRIHFFPSSLSVKYSVETNSPAKTALNGGTRPNDLTSPAQGSYSGFTVTAICGSVAGQGGISVTSSNACTGTLTVKAANTLQTFDWNAYKTDVSGTYKLGAVCTGAKFFAYAGGSATSITVNGVVYPLNSNEEKRWDIGTFKTGDLITFGTGGTNNISQIHCRN